MKIISLILQSTVIVTSLSSLTSAQTMPGEALQLLDGDGDGLVTLEEYSNRMDTLFTGMDTTQNGRLEYSEIDSFVSQDIFDTADTNNNGSLSKGEFDIQVLKDFQGADQNSDGALD